MPISYKDWMKLKVAGKLHGPSDKEKQHEKHKKVSEDRRAEFLHKNKANVMGGLHGSTKGSYK